MTTAKRCIELCAPLQRLVELGMLWRSLLKVDARIAAQSAYSHNPAHAHPHASRARTHNVPHLPPLNRLRSTSDSKSTSSSEPEGTRFQNCMMWLA